MKCQPVPRLLLVAPLLFLALLSLRVPHGTEPPPSDPPAPPETTFQWRRRSEPRGANTSRPAAPTRHPLQPPYPYPYRFLLNEPDKCRDRSPFLVLLVATDPWDVAGRDAIRRTWGNETSVPGVSVLRLFLLGLHPVFGGALAEPLAEESAAHRDLLQQDFLDTYHNLTLKTLMGLEWVSRHCPNASYVMKADADVFLNLPYLVHRFLRGPRRSGFATGFVYRRTGPIRNAAYKWFVPPEVYPNDTYPPYCGGPGYVLSADLAPRVWGVAQSRPLINMEDAFVGLCLWELGVRVSAAPAGTFNMWRVDYDRCRFSRLVMVHHYRGLELLRVWKDFQRTTPDMCP